MSHDNPIGPLLEAVALSPSADDESMGLVSSWLDLQPLHQGHLVACTSEDLGRITLYAAGQPEAFAPAVGTFLADAGASEQELETLASAGEGLEAAQVGSWLALSPDGLDAGWYFPVNMPSAKARNFAPANAVRESLFRWAQRSAVSDCAQLRRSVDPDAPSTEMTFVIPGEDPDHELAIVQQGFASVGAPWFASELDAALRGSDSIELLLSVVIGATGLEACGVLIPEPNEQLLEAAQKQAARFSLDHLDDFDATLDLDLPGMLGCFQYPWGMGLERFFPLGA